MSNLNSLLYIKQNFDKILKEELLKMDCFFQDYLWNGYDDENDPKFITEADFEAIQALTDKIAHMTLNIGCPISVRPMLESIVSRRLKCWQAEKSIETKDEYATYFNTDTKKTFNVLVKRAFEKGRQLKSKNDINKVLKHDGYYHIPNEKRIIKGHFRWNNQGYTLSRRATDLLGYYLIHRF